MAQISRLQFFYLMLWVIMGTGITVLPFSIAQFTVRDGWMIPLFFFLGTVISAGVSVWFIRTFPNQSLLIGFETAFGTWIGRAIGIWILVWFLIHNGLLLRELSIFVEITSLPRTPFYIISAVIIIPITYGVFHGLEVISRLVEVITPIALILSLLIAILSLQNVDVSQLRPVLANGWTPVLRAAVLPSTSFSLQLIMALQVIKSLHNGKTFGRDLLLVGAILALAGVLIEGIITSVLGPASTYLALPVGEVVRGIRIGQFVERLDTIYVMGAMATMTFKISFFLYAMTLTMKEVFRLPTTKNMALPAGVAVWTANILFFHNSPDLHDFMLYTSPAYYVFTLLVLPLLAISFQRITKSIGLRRT